MSNEDIAKELEKDGDYRVIRRLPHISSYATPAEGTVLRRGVVLDFETTGFDFQEDKIIEVGAVSFTFDRAGQIYGVNETFCAYEDPQCDIPEEVQQLTGITPEMVRGHKIDDNAFDSFMKDAVIVIAHNAGFDRKFADTRFPFLIGKPWGCSFRDVDWAAKGISSAKLDYLLMQFGHFHEGHRAEDDCRATLHIAAQSHELDSSRTILSEVLTSAREATYKVWAKDAPFENKDMFSKRKYQWNAKPGKGEFRAWAKEVPEVDLQSELDWLASDVYMAPSVRVPVHKITARERYAPADTVTLQQAMMEGRVNVSHGKDKEDAGSPSFFPKV